jgi:hypothetical protein
MGKSNGALLTLACCIQRVLDVCLLRLIELGPLSYAGIQNQAFQCPECLKGKLRVFLSAVHLDAFLSKGPLTSTNTSQVQAVRMDNFVTKQARAIFLAELHTILCLLLLLCTCHTCQTVTPSGRSVTFFRTTDTFCCHIERNMTTVILALG